MDNNNAIASNDGNISDHVLGIASRHNADLAKTILTNKIMVAAYAISVVILAFGVVVLTVTLGVLCFFHPDKANAWLVLLGSPMAYLAVNHGAKLAQTLAKPSTVAAESLPDLQ